MKMKNKFFFVLDEVSAELNSNCDEGLKNKYIAHFANAFGCKTVRVWLSTKEIIKVKPNDEIEFVAKGLIAFHNYLESLRRAGVERFLLLDWAFVYPYGYFASDRWVVPDPKKEPMMYQRFLKLQQKVRFEIASNFSLIEYFETTNEPDGPASLFLHKNGFDMSCQRDNKDFIFTRDEIEDIILDLNYYETLGVKEANKHAKVLLPSFCNFDYAPSYLDSIYKKIESGKYPTVGEIKSNKVESFFEILNWHPYNLKDVEINDYWLSTQMNLRKVILAHNDKARKVWYTENGWCDFKRENEKQLIAKRFIDLFNIIEEKLPWVETVFLFRLFTLCNRTENEGEDNFGLIYNEFDWDTPLTPKPAAIAIYKYINGENASLDPLYKFAKVKERDYFPHTIINKGGDYKVLILGNHITYQNKAPWNGLNESKGLDASKASKDYAHILFDKLNKELGSVEMTLVDMRNWETCFYYDELYEKLQQFRDNLPDLLIIRLGENTISHTLKDHPYKEYLLKLINLFKDEKTKVILTTTINNIHKIDTLYHEFADENNIPLVDLSSFDKNFNYLSKSSYKNIEHKNCPNDSGMRFIAEQLFDAFKKN